MSANQNFEPINSLVLLWGDLKRKFIAPTKSFTFYTHLMFAVIAGGGMGIWNALYQSTFATEWNLYRIPLLWQSLPQCALLARSAVLYLL